MAIEGCCPSCQKPYSYGDEYAGRMLLCSQCKNIYEVPTPGGVVEDKTTLPPAEMRPREERVHPVIGWENITAGKICFWLGVLCIIGAIFAGGLAGLVSCLPFKPKEMAQRDMMLTIFGGVALFSLFFGIIYIHFGGRIRDGGMISAWLMLLFTLVNIVGSVAGLASQLIGGSHLAAVGKVPTQQVGYFTLAVSFIFLLIYLKLFSCLCTIVTKRHPRPVH